jgi:hypothetical protein
MTKIHNISPKIDAPWAEIDIPIMYVELSLIRNCPLSTRIVFIIPKYNRFFDTYFVVFTRLCNMYILQSRHATTQSRDNITPSICPTTISICEDS